jgi:hypothetical protein
MSKEQGTMSKEKGEMLRKLAECQRQLMFRGWRINEQGDMHQAGRVSASADVSRMAHKRTTSQTPKVLLSQSPNVLIF